MGCCSIPAGGSSTSWPVLIAGGVAFSIGFLLFSLFSLILPNARRGRNGMAAFAELKYDELRRENMPTAREIRCTIAGRMLRYQPALAGYLYSNSTTLFAAILSLAVLCLLAAVVILTAALIAVWL